MARNNNNNNDFYLSVRVCFILVAEPELCMAPIFLADHANGPPKKKDHKELRFRSQHKTYMNT